MKPHPQFPCPRGSRSGSLLVEAMIALVVLVTAVLGFSRTATAGIQQQRSTSERALAQAAALEQLELLSQWPVQDVFARFNSNPLDDPVHGESPGPGFAIERLQPADDDADGMAGQILFPVGYGPSGSLELREDLQADRFGLPFDLDGDGLIGSEDVATTARLLPVVVRVRWRSSSSVQEIELRTWLGDSVLDDSSSGASASQPTSPADSGSAASDGSSGTFQGEDQ